MIVSGCRSPVDRLGCNQEVGRSIRSPAPIGALVRAGEEAALGRFSGESVRVFLQVIHTRPWCLPLTSRALRAMS